MRPLILMSVVLIISGLALGLLNLYIVGRIDAPLMFGIIFVIALVSAVATDSFTRK